MSYVDRFERCLSPFFWCSGVNASGDRPMCYEIQMLKHVVQQPKALGYQPIWLWMHSPDYAKGSGRFQMKVPGSKGHVAKCRVQVKVPIGG